MLSQDEFSTELRATLADHLGAAPEEVAVGDSTPALFRGILALAPGAILYVSDGPRPRPLEGLRATAATSLEELSLLIDATVTLLLIPSPTTPTGKPLTTAEFTQFMATVPQGVTVVLDEAYLDYPDNPDSPDLVSLDAIRRWPNLVALRSYKKEYGLAGVRAHYAFGNPEIISALQDQLAV